MRQRSWRASSALLTTYAVATAAFSLGSLQTLRIAPAAAIADGVSDSVAHLHRPPMTTATLPLALQRHQASPLCALGLGKKKSKTDPVTDVPPLDSHKSRKVALLVEPTPFTHVSGYSNRFNEMLKYLSKAGDNVEIVTADDSPQAPEAAFNYPINTTLHLITFAISVS